MTNGNEAIRKRAQAQARSAKFAPKGANSQLAANASALTLKCKVCFTSFMSTQKSQLPAHYDSKHSKVSWDECFDIPREDCIKKKK